MSQSAPVVTYPITRSPRLAGWLLAVAAAGLGVLWAWGLWGAPAGQTTMAIAAAAWLLCATLAARFWWQSPQGRLLWDGYHWGWTPSSGTASGPGSAHIHLDWQHSLWVRWQSDDRTQVCWFWLEQRHTPAQWADLRRALHAPPAPPPSTSTP